MNRQPQEDAENYWKLSRNNGPHYRGYHLPTSRLNTYQEPESHVNIEILPEKTNDLIGRMKSVRSELSK